MIYTMIYTKVCKLCGKKFEAKSNKATVCKDIHWGTCSVCGKQYVRKPPYTTETCSLKCGQVNGNLARAKTMLDKYGVTNPMQVDAVKEKARATCISKYGVDNPSRCDAIKHKIASTFQNQLGVDNPMKCPEIQRRQSDSVRQHYGVSSPLQSKIVMDKLKRTNLIRYGYENVLASPEIQNRIQDDREQRTGYRYVSSDPQVISKISKTCQSKYGVAFSCMRPECRSSYRTISKINQQFSERLNQSNIDHTLEFSLGRYSFDFRIGQVLVEIDPSITHNTRLSIFPDAEPTAVDYHLKKTQLAAENGYQCIHVFDWDNWDKIIQLLLNKSKIGARKCSVVNIDEKTSSEFTQMYHLSGSCRGQKVNYGLYHDGELVEVMTFGKPRYNSKYEYELLRLCTKTGVEVVGGASKLFHHFIEDHSKCTVISYCDRSKFTGSVYTTIGMNLVRTTSPNVVWSKGDKKITQNLLNQRGFDQLFKTSYGKGTSNEELMIQHGWLPVSDCGQLVFEYIP